MELVWQWDTAIQQAINRGWSSPTLDVVFLVLTYLGVGAVQVLIIAPFVLVRGLKVTAATCLTAYVVSGLSVRLMKMLFPRPRPSNWPDTIAAEPHLQSSFPSGHTVTAFAIAFALLYMWPGRRRLLAGVLALALATLVGVSRVYRGVHWPTDVAGGAALGFISAVAAVAIVEAVIARKARRTETT